MNTFTVKVKYLCILISVFSANTPVRRRNGYGDRLPSSTFVISHRDGICFERRIPIDRSKRKESIKVFLHCRSSVCDNGKFFNSEIVMLSYKEAISLHKCIENMEKCCYLPGERTVEHDGIRIVFDVDAYLEVEILQAVVNDKPSPKLKEELTIYFNE